MILFISLLKTNVDKYFFFGFGCHFVSVINIFHQKIRHNIVQKKKSPSLLTTQHATTYSDQTWPVDTIITILCSKRIYHFVT